MIPCKSAVSQDLTLRTPDSLDQLKDHLTRKLNYI